MLRNFLNLPPQWTQPAEEKLETVSKGETYSPNQKPEKKAETTPEKSDDILKASKDNDQVSCTNYDWLVQQQSLIFDPTLHNLYGQHYQKAGNFGGAGTAVQQGPSSHCTHCAFISTREGRKRREVMDVMCRKILLPCKDSKTDNYRKEAGWFVVHNLISSAEFRSIT